MLVFKTWDLGLIRIYTYPADLGPGSDENIYAYPADLGSIRMYAYPGPCWKIQNAWKRYFPPKISPSGKSCLLKLMDSVFDSRALGK